MEPCKKEAIVGTLVTEVANLKEDVKILNKVVMEGNGNDALMVSVPKLAQAVKTFTPAVEKLTEEVSKSRHYQDQMEGYHKGKNTVKRRNRWLIGLLVTIILGLVTTVVVLIT
jgi:hypothetical protein